MSSGDVVVPCYNYAKYLQQCVQSVLGQRDTSVRVLILDDASPGNTPEIAGQLAATDERVTYVRNESNLGLIGTANKGVLESASAEYVILLSADDALTPGPLARSTRLVGANTDIGLAYGMAVMLHDDGPTLAVDDFDSSALRIIAGRELLRLLCAYGNFVPTRAVELDALRAGSGSAGGIQADLCPGQKYAARGGDTAHVCYLDG